MPSRTGVLKPLSLFAPEVRPRNTPVCAHTSPKRAHTHPPRSDTRQILVTCTSSSCRTSSRPECPGHLPGSPPPALSSPRFWVQTARPSENVAGTVGLTASEGTGRAAGTCRTPPPTTAARVPSPRHPAPGGPCGLLSRSRALGSAIQAGSPFPTPHIPRGGAVLTLWPPATPGSWCLAVLLLGGHPLSLSPL